jgi:hypothetical protein
MTTTPNDRRAMQHGADLEPQLRVVEERLVALGAALQRQDIVALDLVAAELHDALATAVDRFGRAARAGGVPPGLRQRLATAGGQVAAQREALARATASLDRAIEVLIPRVGGAGLYTSAGETQRAGLPGNGLLA